MSYLGKRKKTPTNGKQNFAWIKPNGLYMSRWEKQARGLMKGNWSTYYQNRPELNPFK